MKLKRKIGFLLMVVTLLLCTITPVFAAGADCTAVSSPICMLANVSDAITVFLIVDTNNAVVNAYYCGYPGITTNGTIEIKLQKKFLFWWTDVNNGQPNNTWTDTFTGYDGSVSHSLRLSQTGEYRALVTYTVYGSGGETDVIPVTMYDTY
ncbi:MAG: hypothetical protein VB118_02190 [Oscillospiraceae bacterium]|nr:hypothetical protein [Oscillospiraceae bacterium]